MRKNKRKTEKKRQVLENVNGEKSGEGLKEEVCRSHTAIWRKNVCEGCNIAAYCNKGNMHISHLLIEQKIKL